MSSAVHDPGRLAGKVAFITGGSSGIGRATALVLAREGAHVIVCARREEPCREVVADIARAGGSGGYVLADVCSEPQVAAAIQEVIDGHGGLDIAFNNAGSWTYEALDAVTADRWQTQIELNLTSVFYSMKHEIPAMRTRGGGAIVNNASVAGLVGNDAGLAPYAAAKHGVVGLTRSAALELAADRIRVNAIAPGVVDTPRFRAEQGSTTAGAQAAGAAHPLGRVGTAEETAELVLFLASDQSAFMTGTAIPMDGGWTAR